MVVNKRKKRRKRSTKAKIPIKKGKKTAGKTTEIGRTKSLAKTIGRTQKRKKITAVRNRKKKRQTVIKHNQIDTNVVKRQIILFLIGLIWVSIAFIPKIYGKGSLNTLVSTIRGSTDNVIYVESGQQLSQFTTSFSQEPVKIDRNLLKKSKKEGPVPKRIIIPSLGIDLDVGTSKIIKGYWQVFADKAGFGQGSAFPGEKGNQVIFAHAREGLFIDLPKISIGDTIYVLSDNNWYRYEVKEKKEVFPDKLEVISPTKDETLTLYTCSGFADSKRLIIVAKRTT